MEEPETQAIFELSDSDIFCGEQFDGILKSISEGMSHQEVENRIRHMVNTNRLQVTDITIKQLIAAAVREYLDKNPPVQNTTVNITNSPHASVIINHTTPQKVKKLALRRLDDPRLKLMDRIVFSFLWKWSWNNAKKKRSTYVPTTRNLRRATGANGATIKKSLINLTAMGYISETRKPLITLRDGKQTLDNGVKYLGFWKCEWKESSCNSDLRRTVAHCVIAYCKQRQKTDAWLVRALGISRMTAHRYLKVFQFDTPSGSV